MLNELGTVLAKFGLKMNFMKIKFMANTKFMTTNAISGKIHYLGHKIKITRLMKGTTLDWAAFRAVADVLKNIAYFLNM